MGKGVGLELQRCEKGLVMGILNPLAAFAGHVLKDMESWKHLLWKIRSSPMPTTDACSTATGTVGQKRGREDDEHGSGEKRTRMGRQVQLPVLVPNPKSCIQKL